MLPSNYALAKSICGDPTDNIPGVKGVGYKTLAKRFPELGKQELSLKDIIQLSEQRKETRVRAFKDIYTSSDLIARNLRVIHLDSSNLAAVQVRKIEATIDSFKPSRNKMQLMRQLINEGLETYDAHNLFSAFLLV
jgi:5'-3' exonuclease